MVVANTSTVGDVISTTNDEKVATVAWGFTLGFGVLTFVKIIEQTIRISRKIGFMRSVYLWMVWILYIDNFIGSVIIWLHINGNIKSSYPYFIILLTIWATMVQLLPQIIINRIGILLDDRARLWRYKFVTAVIMTLLVISVFCIWIPAHMDISERYIAINNIWDRCEKGIYLLVDLFLNITYLHLVHSRLVAYGLNKYKPLFWFTAGMISISLSMDVLLLGMMSLRNTFVYAQFHPLVYLVKLHIEMGMSDFIVTLAKTPSDIGHVDESTTWASETQQTSSFQSTSKDLQQNIEMGIPRASDASERAQEQRT